MAKTFELGLVMAGAVSAGAYTGGVIDYLIEALDRWQAAKEGGDPDIPAHDVSIRALTGTSAGAMTCAIAGIVLNEDFAPVRDLPAPGAATGNKLYDSWVREIDIDLLLGLGDLDAKDATVESLLNSAPLDAIAGKALALSPRAGRRAYVADPLDVFLCVTNLRGVPYSLRFRGAAGVEHGMTAHADHMRFGVTWEAGTALHNSALRLVPGAGEHWATFKESALASGAFPVGLKPRLLHRAAGHYNRREWLVPRAAADGGGFELTEIAPDWNLDDAAGYDFLNVDGGVMNNEPLELARQALAGAEGRNPRGAKEAHRAVVMIDPFPNPVLFDPDYEADPSLAAVVGRMFNSLIAQARFKPDELALARDTQVYSRFVMAPSRHRNPTDPAAGIEPHALACGGLGGFGGFLSESFRRHDFQLGRRNGQRFLREHFLLHEDNPVFGGWWTEAASAEARATHGRQQDGGWFFPIVPVLDEGEIAQPDWPHIDSVRLERIRSAIHDRADRVVDRLLRRHLPGWFLRQGVWAGWAFKRKQVVSSIMETIAGDLAKRGLL